MVENIQPKRRSALEAIGMSPEQFAERIRTYRSTRRLSQTEMGARLGGLTNMTISRWEHGQSIPTSKLIIGLLQRENVL